MGRTKQQERMSSPIYVLEMGLKGHLRHLQQPDNAIEINNGLESYLARATKGMLTSETASEVELQSIPVLLGGDEG
jgi:hypothetical protein